MLRPRGWKCQVLPKWNSWQPSVALCDRRWSWGKRSQAPRAEGPQLFLSHSQAEEQCPDCRGLVAELDLCPSWEAAHTQILVAEGNQALNGEESRWGWEILTGRRQWVFWRRTKIEGDSTSLNLSCFLLSNLLLATGVWANVITSFSPPCTKLSYLVDSKMND